MLESATGRPRLLAPNFTSDAFVQTAGAAVDRFALFFAFYGLEFRCGSLAIDRDVKAMESGRVTISRRITCGERKSLLDLRGFATRGRTCVI